MRNRTLRNRMKAAFLTAALIGTTLLGSMAAYAETTTVKNVKESAAEKGTTVELPIEQYFRISKAATAPIPKLNGTYTVTGDVQASATLENTSDGSVNGILKLTFPGVGVYNAELLIDAVATSTFGDSASFKDTYYITAYVKNNLTAEGGFVTDITASKVKDDPSKKVGEIVFGVCADDPPVRKKIEGVQNSTEEFDFHMKQTEGSPVRMPKGGESGEKVVTDGEGPVEFGWMFYNTPGVYKYEISEVHAAKDNWTFDTQKYIKTVTITENAESKRLEINSEYDHSVNGEALFTNTYSEPSTTPSGGGGTPSGGGGGRRSRPETSNNPPTTPGEVLGATRDAAEDAGRGVLGAVRNPQGQVLGAVRTGDSSAMVTWAVILMLAASGIVGWVNMYQRRKRNI